MKKNRHTDEQIVKILREADQSTVAEATRKHSVTEQTVYRWRRLYDGMQVSDIKELKGLRDFPAASLWRAHHNASCRHL